MSRKESSKEYSQAANIHVPFTNGSVVVYKRKMHRAYAESTLYMIICRCRSWEFA